MGELDAHVAESAEADDADLLAFGHAPVAHGRVGGDSGALQRRGSGKVEVLGNAEDEVLLDDDAVRVAAVGDAARVLVREVIGEGQVRAELFKACLAFRACAVGIHEAANGGQVAGLELLDAGADLGDAADDLMAGDAGIDGGHHAAPLVAGLVEIGVADAAEEDLDLDVVPVGSRRS